MANDVAVSKVEIRIGEAAISLTPDQIKALRDALNELCPVAQGVPHHSHSCYMGCWHSYWTAQPLVPPVTWGETLYDSNGGSYAAAGTSFTLKEASGRS